MDETDDVTQGPDDGPTPDGADAPPAFRLGYVPGATPGKWARTWAQRRPDLPLDLVPVPVGDAADFLRGGAVDAALVRLPADRDDLHVIPLYEEVAVVVVPKDHLLAALEESEHVPLAELDDEVLLQPADDVLAWPGPVPGRRPVEQPTTTGLAVELVAAGVGVLVVPQSLARLHHRKDLTYRLLDDAPSAPVALAWPVDATTDDVDDFVGIVRGRTANSSRGRRVEDAEPASKGRAASSSAKRPKDGGGHGRGAAKGRSGKPGARRTGGSRRRPR
ncbi:LysR family transcriptional regulator [Luteimicrobium album]|uniref:LysR family transcriptional regulator n=1 Tax=Luteimicrobium album TaxID=1054550 RepID=A0ABQ6I2H6_9MICO|nr:LysR substrate-binding domain-containing protein [Luteimicrobium album]GMA24970.1 LysR family transcriptional regulator [Luteimicrobium album]